MIKFEFKRALWLTALIVAVTLPQSAKTEEVASQQLVIKNHIFEPTELIVPAGKPFKLVIINQDPTPEEFESKALKREKVIKGNSQIELNIGALKAGEYSFVGEYHESTAKGKIIAQ